MRILLAGATLLALAGISPVFAAECQTGPGYFDYGPQRADREAEQLAMELSGELRAPDDWYYRLLYDLQLIRVAYPFLQWMEDDPTWTTDKLTVHLYPELPWTGYEDMNTYYQVIDEELGPTGSFYLTFCDSINPEALAAIYMTLPEVEWASPQTIIGQNETITVTPLGTTYRYELVDGWGWCADGCDCEYRWIVEVAEDGSVSLISYDEIDYEMGYACEFSDWACCLPGDSCDLMAIGACLAQGGAPSAEDPCFRDHDSDGLSNVCDPDDDNDGFPDVPHGFGHPGDNCPRISNPSQSDWDGDQEGDVCDRDDGRIHVYFESPDFVVWQFETGSESFNLYTGDLDVLVVDGLYTQLPGSNPLASRNCSLQSTSVNVPADGLDAGKTMFLLATGIAGGSEGDLGRDSEGNVRPNDNPCPEPPP